MKALLTLIIGIVMTAPCSADDVTSPTVLRATIADTIGWVDDPNAPNFCQGYYINPLLGWHAGQVIALDESVISADYASLVRAGRSVLKGNVMVDQTSRQLSADTAEIIRDPQTGEIKEIKLLGNIQIREPGRLLTGTRAVFRQPDQFIQIHDAHYRMALNDNHLQSYGVNGWGHASWIKKDEKNHYYLRRATYSTCPPNDNAWRIEALRIKLNPQSGRGQAWDARLKLGDTSVFYLPYYNFPIDDRRQSGFLLPLVAYNNREGTSLSFPYYINLAPNYDLTLQPRWLSGRAGALAAEFRYLTDTSQGTIEGQILPDDKRAEQHSTRAWVQWFQHSRFNEFWQAGVDASYVSDDNYFQDFGYDIPMATQNQLLRQVYVNYSDVHWDFLTNVQNYQTLNPLGQPKVTKIYNRLPQVILNADYPEVFGPLNLSLESEYDHFVDGPKLASGDRWVANPRASLTFAAQQGYFEPAAELLTSFYRLHTAEFDRVLPRFSLDSGLFFERQQPSYTQTLEPRVFYLYTPYHDQSSIPVFDSAYTVFNFDQLFRTNRFSGFDRISDANQLSVALTSRILDNHTGIERWRLATGTTFYWQDRRVGLCEEVGCIDSNQRKGFTSPTADISPIASELSYNINQVFSLHSNLAWDPNVQNTNNAAVRLHYQKNPNKIIDLAYSYFVNGDPDLHGNDLHQLHLGVAWPLNKRWSTLGNWSYNLNADHDLSYYLGVQYESCCWALRLMGGKVFTHLGVGFVPVYQDTIYLQFLLRGLGTVGNRSPGHVLQTMVPGYRDVFK